MRHILEDSLEQYAMGALPEPQAEPLEEHLLICAACQDRLQATDVYVAAMRAAAIASLKAPKKKMAAKKKTAVKKLATKKAAPAPAVRRASAE